ncbi:FAR1 DNA binding domain, Zinc finger, SWIM-type, MULE transposase domain, FHY3/FAR1 family [Artemisia annua]|uniref:FAR1 DNA binding domain, Zinc finger, SWIM-type, MULE transposase domain, FHY3/FAR1 family n=1 Tax=Artemisia annua TaxID=35608 RepID=A0A2U1P061_ARTAN|nr:FAR1 DNA binding domain, Zinc finger, SWIM-type, MULE transposase domain, FHY3/FAR1 family [Artemisia annua]
MSDSIDIQLNDNYVAGEPLTPRSVNNEPHVVFGDSLFTPPHDHQVGIFQPTPNGTKYWVPKVINKPVEGQVFDTLELALNAYKDYAREGGFEVRKGGQKHTKDRKAEPKNKYFYCVRQGFKPPPKAENQKAHKQPPTNPLGVTKVIKRRKRASCHCGCTAQPRLKKLPDGRYSVSKFIEKHNHSLVYEDDIKYLRASRRLTFPKQQLLNQLSNVNIGPIRSWKVLKEMYGGFEYIGATDVECKNYKRGLNEFIAERDAQMAENQKAHKQKPTNPLGVTKVIKRRKRASCRCGCTAQLRLKKLPDGRYSVSKFIEKHNHSLVYEDDIKYLRASRRLTFPKQQLLNQLSNVNIGPIRSWKVLKEMYGGFEYIGATDVECKNYKRGLNEFIAERDAQMVGPTLCSNTDFKRRLCGIIWTDRIEPEVFDEQWNKIITDFELTEHKWLQDMFEMRKNTHDSKYTTPDFKTHLQVEKEAAELYTHTVFYDVQDEIFESLFHCCSLSVQEDDTSLTYMIRDIEADYTPVHGVLVEAKYEVKLSKVFHFPRKYLQRRWSKYALPNKIVTRPVDIASLSNPIECVNGVVREIYGTVEQSVTRLVTDIQKLTIYKDDLDTLLEQVKIDIPNAPEMSKKELYAAALGVKEPETVNIVALNVVIKDLFL